MSRQVSYNEMRRMYQTVACFGRQDFADSKFAKRPSVLCESQIHAKSHFKVQIL